MNPKLILVNGEVLKQVLSGVWTTASVIILLSFITSRFGSRQHKGLTFYKKKILIIIVIVVLVFVLRLENTCRERSLERLNGTMLSFSRSLSVGVNPPQTGRPVACKAASVTG